jgi:hypothetical protein
MVERPPGEVSPYSKEGKADWANRFVRFVQSGFKWSLFTKGFYSRLSMCRGHIAHYDRHGFYDEWFSTPERRADFLELWANAPVYGDPKYTYSDVERALSSWLKDGPLVEKYRNEHRAAVEESGRATLARLKAKYEEEGR